MQFAAISEVETDRFPGMLAGSKNRKRCLAACTRHSLGGLFKNGEIVEFLRQYIHKSM
jgi:hypothetical protein